MFPESMTDDRSGPGTKAEADKLAALEKAARQAAGNPTRRRLALADYAILDTPPDPAFDDLTRLAATLCATPIALVSLVDRDRQWFKSHTGLGVRETPIVQSVCAHALAESSPLIIPDLERDPRTRDNPLVTGPENLRFYAGTQLRNAAGTPIGTLCVIDTVARPGGLDPLQRQALELLGRQVMALMEMRIRLMHRNEDVRAARQSDARSSARAASSEASETRARLAQEAGKIGTFELEVATGAMQVSAQFCRIFGVPVAPAYAAAVFETLVHPEDAKVRSTEASRQSGRGEPDVEYRIHRADDGQLRWISRHSEFLRDSSGRPHTMLGTVRDVTEAKQASLRMAALLELGEALRNAASAPAMLAAVLACLGQGMGLLRAGHAEIDPKDGSALVTQDWCAAGVESLAGRHAPGLFNPEIFAPGAGVQVLQDVLQPGPEAADSAGAASQDRLAALAVRGQILLPLVLRGQPPGLLFLQAAQPRAWSQGEMDFARTVTERSRAALARLRIEARQQVLNHELSHRLKNTLSMVQAIASQTLRRVSPREPVEALERRLEALSVAHDVLLQQDWTAAELQGVAERVLGMLGQSGQVRLQGPEVRLGPRSALTAAMLLHELGTNALKYGALSVESGRLLLRWELAEAEGGPALRLLWQESGGPPVVPPRQTGFGSKLVRMGLTGAGGVELRYRPEGLEVEMRAPLAEVEGQ